MSFQDLIAESLFTNRRGSPNTISLKEQEEEARHSAPFNIGTSTNLFSGSKENSSNMRILSFKERRKRGSMSLQNNLSVINEIA